MIDHESFGKLVELDLWGKCTEEETQTLESDLEEWRDSLGLLLREIDAQFTSRRAQMLSSGTTEAKIDYEKWKKFAVGRKLALVTRLQDVKMMIKDQNVAKKITEDEEKANRPNYMIDVLIELKSIRSVLEERLKP